MKILVAGGAGYLGTALVPRLLDRGYEVTVLDLLWFGDHLPQGVRVVQTDVLEANAEMLSGFDQVIFLAGISNDPMAEYSPGRNFVSNAAAPAYLAYIAKQAGVRRYTYASSCSVYGYAVDQLYTEEHPAVSSYPYGISKLQGESGCLQQLDENFSVISLRMGTVCGYSPRMRLDLVVNTMFRAAYQEGRITVNNPAIWRPILSIDDATAAYVRAVEADPSVSGIFNLASGNYTIGEVGDCVAEAFSEKLGRRIELTIHHQDDLRNYKVDCGKAIRILGFKPKHGIEAILQTLFDNIEKFRDFSNRNYYNIQIFRDLQHQPGAMMPFAGDSQESTTTPHRPTAPPRD